MSVLYVLSDGATLRKRNESIAVVTAEGEILQDIELRRLEAVVLFSSVQITTPALCGLLEHGVDLAVISHGGKLLGRILPPASPATQLRRRQYALFGEAGSALRLAQALVEAKIANQSQLLRYVVRHSENPPALLEGIIAQLDSATEQLSTVESLEALRGCEGAAARAYWTAFGACLSVPGVEFAGRQYRPAPDPVNATLSFGYTLLANTVHHLLDALGLDPYVGFFHADAAGRASLALDMIEPFRAPVVDRMVLRLFHLKILQAEDFCRGEDGSMRLQPEPRRRFLEEYEKTLARQQVRQALRGQVESLRRHLLDPSQPLEFFLWRET
jgi:CRISPR-associated protein Cas1